MSGFNRNHRVYEEPKMFMPHPFNYKDFFTRNLNFYFIFLWGATESLFCYTLKRAYKDHPFGNRKLVFTRIWSLHRGKN